MCQDSTAARSHLRHTSDMERLFQIQSGLLLLFLLLLFSNLPLLLLPFWTLLDTQATCRKSDALLLKACLTMVASPASLQEIRSSDAVDLVSPLSSHLQMFTPIFFFLSFNRNKVGAYQCLIPLSLNQLFEDEDVSSHGYYPARLHRCP